jgi:hypothetical protein
LHEVSKIVKLRLSVVMHVCILVTSALAKNKQKRAGGVAEVIQDLNSNIHTHTHTHTHAHTHTHTESNSEENREVVVRGRVGEEWAIQLV